MFCRAIPRYQHSAPFATEALRVCIMYVLSFPSLTIWFVRFPAWRDRRCQRARKQFLNGNYSEHTDYVGHPILLGPHDRITGSQSTNKDSMYRFSKNGSPNQWQVQSWAWTTDTHVRIAHPPRLHEPRSTCMTINIFRQLLHNILHPEALTSNVFAKGHLVSA